eukprot:6210831-Pleurochrysis_carterae.AAC.2
MSDWRGQAHICVWARGGEGGVQTQESWRASMLAKSARASAVLRRRGACSMRYCRTRVRQSSRSYSNYYSHMNENWILAS